MRGASPRFCRIMFTVVIGGIYFDIMSLIHHLAERLMFTPHVTLGSGVNGAIFFAMIGFFWIRTGTWRDLPWPAVFLSFMVGASFVGIVSRGYLTDILTLWVDVLWASVWMPPKSKRRAKDAKNALLSKLLDRARPVFAPVRAS